MTKSRPRLNGLIVVTGAAVMMALATGCAQGVADPAEVEPQLFPGQVEAEQGELGQQEAEGRSTGIPILAQATPSSIFKMNIGGQLHVGMPGRTPSNSFYYNHNYSTGNWWPAPGMFETLLEEDPDHPWALLTPVNDIRPWEDKGVTAAYTYTDPNTGWGMFTFMSKDRGWAMCTTQCDWVDDQGVQHSVGRFGELFSIDLDALASDHVWKQLGRRNHPNIVPWTHAEGITGAFESQIGETKFYLFGDTEYWTMSTLWNEGHGEYQLTADNLNADGKAPGRLVSQLTDGEMTRVTGGTELDGQIVLFDGPRWKLFTRSGDQFLYTGKYGDEPTNMTTCVKWDINCSPEAALVDEPVVSLTRSGNREVEVLFEHKPFYPRGFELWGSTWARLHLRSDREGHIDGVRWEAHAYETDDIAQAQGGFVCVASLLRIHVGDNFFEVGDDTGWQSVDWDVQHGDPVVVYYGDNNEFCDSSRAGLLGGV